MTLFDAMNEAIESMRKLLGPNQSFSLGLDVETEGFVMGGTAQTVQIELEYRDEFPVCWVKSDPKKPGVMQVTYGVDAGMKLTGIPLVVQALAPEEGGSDGIPATLTFWNIGSEDGDQFQHESGDLPCAIGQWKRAEAPVLTGSLSGGNGTVTLTIGNSIWKHCI